METSLADLCKGLDPCFKDFMEYCKKLEFTEDPDYKICLGFFDEALKRNNFDKSIYDYTWKEDRLKRDKKALKDELMKTLGPKKKAEPTKE